MQSGTARNDAIDNAVPASIGPKDQLAAALIPSSSNDDTLTLSISKGILEVLRKRVASPQPVAGLGFQSE
jgi:hypothetical protein